MRDTHATGKGSIMGAGTAGYCTGNLQIDGYVQPHEDTSFPYPGVCCGVVVLMVGFFFPPKFRVTHPTETNHLPNKQHPQRTWLPHSKS